MAGKKEIEPLVRVTTNLYEADYLVMKVAYETIGAQVAIRKIIRAHVNKLRGKAEELADDDEEEEGVRSYEPREA